MEFLPGVKEHHNGGGREIAGLAATFYDDSQGHAPVVTRQDLTVDWSQSDRLPIASLTNSEFMVRWAGFLKASTGFPYSFYTHFPGWQGTEERVRLWVDNELIIDQWSSLAGTGLTGHFGEGHFYSRDGDTGVYEIGEHPETLRGQSRSADCSLALSSSLFLISSCLIQPWSTSAAPTQATSAGTSSGGKTRRKS